LEKAIEGVDRSVVVGGGLIGVCVAESLCRRGVAVTVVELRDRILSLLLDDVASEIIRDSMQSSGISILTNHTVQKILGDPDADHPVREVILDDGKSIPCDIVILAAGVRPRIELVEVSDPE